MKNKWLINFNVLYLFVISAAAVSILWGVKNLYFFDEDIFIVNRQSEFLQLIWQRCTAVKFTYLIDNYFWSKNPLGYHITNLFFHIANTILAIKVFISLLKSTGIFVNHYQLQTALLIFCILFLFTPIHSEPICYILGRDGLLVTFFCLISILSFLKARFQMSIYFFISLFSFLLALFSYEISWTMPFIILCIGIYISDTSNKSVKKKALLVIPYFFIFIAWVIVKVIFIDKGAITDYNDANLTKIHFVVLLRNNIVLFLRNFIPPFVSTSSFVSAGILFSLVLFCAFFKLFKTNKKIFTFSVLLIILIFSGCFPASLFGISSHNSESERYVYFSSVFAIMLLAVLITVFIHSNPLLIVIVLILGIVYGVSLFKTISYYNKAGSFAKKYLSVINKKQLKKDNVFLLNLPSQFHGALIFRANSRMNSNKKFSISTVNEFIHYLYPGSREKYITLSSKELTVNQKITNAYDKPLDSINYFFPFIKINFADAVIKTPLVENFPFNNSNSAIVAVNDTALFIFK
jgi:hypothetical protein